MMNLGNLRKAKGSTRKKRIVGRGKGSGMGNQATKGHGGQLSRSGAKRPYVGFEGGQMRLMRRLPKRGFTNNRRIEFAVVNLVQLESIYEANATVTVENMVENGLVRNFKLPVKILARGEVTKPLNVQAHHFSNAAKDLIEKAGGKAEVI
jgi:large subunit ribosomal protein L15